MKNENEPLSQDLLWDAHTHYLNEVSLPENHVSLVNAVTENDYSSLVRLCAGNSRIIPFFGLHPWFLKEASSRWRENLLDYLSRIPWAGVGEAGLDKAAAARGKALAMKEQELFFRGQVELARDCGRPLAIHCVGAWGLMTEIIEEYYPKADKAGVLFHAYQGSGETAFRLMRRGVFFSFSLEGLKANPELVASLPLEHLLLETDGKEPKAELLNGAYTKLAEIFEIPKEEMFRRIMENGTVFTRGGTAG